MIAMRILKPHEKESKALVLFLISIFFFAAASAQTKTIKGTITDAKGSPLAGASITLQQGAGGTFSDTSGNFQIDVPAGAEALVISNVGFRTEVVDIKTRTEVIVTLQEGGNNTLEDVVVIGYGTEKKKDVTGALATVNEKNFNRGFISNPVKQIQGKVAGLVITQPNGDPNADLIIRLRGQTSLSGGQNPLIVVDGVPLDNSSQLQNIPPGDIESYNVLKDASAAAIFGSRGANGVIMITTKKGKAGKSVVEYNGLAGADMIAKKPDLLNASEYRSQLTDNTFDKGGNTDWWDEMTRTGVTQSHNLSVSGGTGSFNYRASASYLNQTGIVINTGKNEIGLRFNAEQKALNDRLDIQLGIMNSHVNRKYIDYQTWQVINNSPPTYPVYNEDGSYFTYYSQDVYNPVATQNLETNAARDNFTQLYGTINYEIISGLKIGAFGAMNYYNYEKDYYVPVLPGVGNINSGSKSDADANSQRGDIHINYAGLWNKHSLTFTGVYEYNHFSNINFGAYGQQYLVDNLGVNALQNGNAATNVINSYRDESRLISFVGRASYNYNSKYYATVSFRRDGSSKFGTNNRWGNFPSASVAWRIGQESFIKDNVSWIDELKLSAGFGITGNQDAISPYNTLLTLGTGSRYYDAASNTYPVSYTPTQNANPYLQWEERHGKNIGLNLAVLKSRFTADINVFNDETRKLLFNYSVPTPPFFVNNILANVGTMSNKGVEIQLAADIVRSKLVTWNLSGQITFIKTRIDALSGTYTGVNLKTDHIGAGLDYTNAHYLTYLQVGYAPYVFYLLHSTGITDDGKELFDDKKGGQVTADATSEDMKNYIDPSPKFTYGFSNTLNVGNWSLNFFFQGVAGQKVYNNTNAVLADINRLPGKNILREGLTNGLKFGPVMSDRWLEDASFLRLDNITLGYAFTKIPSIQSLRVFVTATNLFVITKYNGLDPEIRTGNSYANRNYIDLSYGPDGFYPRSRNVSLGVSVSFK